MVFPDTEKWKTLLEADRKSLNAASLQIHYATQFIAILGKYLLESNPDDSHTNAEWLQEHDLLAGNWIKGEKLFRLALDIKKFELLFLDNEIKELDSVKLDGKTREDILAWIKTIAFKLGKNAESLQLTMHYEIPKTDIALGKPFVKPEQKILDELSKLRSDADLILNFVASKFKNSEPVRVWPHHFDTGTLLPVKKDEDGKLVKSIGLGMAVPDSIVNDYYFYVSPWSSENKINYDSLPDLGNNGKWHIQNWNGVYLPASEVTKTESKEGQAEIVNGFFISAIDACLFLLDSTGLFSESSLPA